MCFSCFLTGQLHEEYFSLLKTFAQSRNEITWWHSSCVTRILWIQSMGKKNSTGRERLDRNQCWAVTSITKDAKNLQELFKCELALDLEFFSYEKE